MSVNCADDEVEGPPWSLLAWVVAPKGGRQKNESEGEKHNVSVSWMPMYLSFIVRLIQSDKQEIPFRDVIKDRSSLAKGKRVDDPVQNYC